MAFDEYGLVVPRAPEILTNIQEYQIANVTDKFKYQNNKIIYQLNSIYALQAASLSELIEASFDSIKLSAAEGNALEELGLLRGVYRGAAVPSSSTSQYAWLDNGATIPSNTVFSSTTLDNTAINTVNITGDATNCNSFRFIITSVANTTEYKITINAVEYSFTSDGSATRAEIHAGLIAEFDADADKTFTYSDETTYIEIIADEDTTLAGALDTSLVQITEVKVYFYVEAVVAGATAFPANTINKVNTAVVGLIETNNDEDYTVGTDVETDPEFRISIQEGNRNGCSGTLLSIKAALESVSGVTAVNIIENTDQYPTDAENRPEHSYECLVVGGSNEDVATVVWTTKPIGIELYGNTIVPITDSSGTERSPKFSRPTKINFAVNIEYTLYDEEVFPTDGEDLITAAVVSYISSLPLGKDLIPTRMYGIVYNAAEGIEELTIEIQTLVSSGDAPDGGSWVTTPIAIASTEYAYTELVDVYIAEV